VIIPVTGADRSGPHSPGGLAGGLLTNLGLASLGLALVFFGMSRRKPRSS
jgi:hypothetical protein